MKNMNNSEIQLRDHLFFLLERLDNKLLQRVLDYTSGLVAGAEQTEVNDWWDDLPLDKQAHIDKGLAEIEKGDVISDKDLWAQIKQLFDNQNNK
jgi:predicted transcriptional regulator